MTILLTRIAGWTRKATNTHSEHVIRIAFSLQQWLHERLSVRDRKQRTDIAKYSSVNKTIKNWNQLPVEALGIFPCKPKILRKS